MSRHRALSAIVVCLSILALPPATRAASEETGSVVTFGAVLPLTGEVANWGEDSAHGIDVALDLANQATTKFRFQVVYEDSKGKGAEAVAAVRKLIGVNKVAAIIGDNVSGPTVAMVPVADTAKVPIISPSASSPKLSGMSPYFFRVYPSDTAEGAFMADVAVHRLKLKRVAILFVNNDFGVGLSDVFKKDFAQSGGSVVETLGYNEDETDFRPYLTKVKAASPDGVYLAGYYKDGGAILKQARELGVEAQFLGSTTHEDPQLLTTAGDAANGFLYPFSTGYDEHSSAAQVVKFQKAFKAKFGKPPGLIAALGYDCANLLITAVESRGANAEAIRSFLAGTKGYQGATGEMTFDNNGDVHKPVLLKTVREGKFVPIGDPHPGETP
jgi:branched-chain amino acid transport system substrate-binding protein